MARSALVHQVQAAQSMPHAKRVLTPNAAPTPPHLPGRAKRGRRAAAAHLPQRPQGCRSAYAHNERHAHTPKSSPLACCVDVRCDRLKQPQLFLLQPQQPVALHIHGRLARALQPLQPRQLGQPANQISRLQSCNIFASQTNLTRITSTTTRKSQVLHTHLAPASSAGHLLVTLRPCRLVPSRHSSCVSTAV